LGLVEKALMADLSRNRFRAIFKEDSASGFALRLRDYRNTGFSTHLLLWEND
jgi:hypothetical protein